MRTDEDCWEGAGEEKRRSGWEVKMTAVWYTWRQHEMNGEKTGEINEDNNPLG